MYVIADMANYEIDYETNNILRSTAHEMGYDYPEGDLARKAIVARTIGCAGLMEGTVSNGQKDARVMICGSEASAVEPQNRDIVFEMARVDRQQNSGGNSVK